VIPLAITNQARKGIAPGAWDHVANQAVLADLADGWTLVPTQDDKNGRYPRNQEIVQLIGREYAYPATLPGYRLPDDDWCICERDVEPCGCRANPQPGDCGKVKLIGCKRLSTRDHMAALGGDRYTDPFGLEGETAWGNRWADELYERWTRVHARVRRRAGKDVLDLWNDVMKVHKLLARALADPVPYEDVEVDDEGFLQFTLADASQRIPHDVVYELEGHERLRLRALDVEDGVLTCDSGEAHPDLVRSFADAQQGRRRRLVLDARATSGSLDNEQRALDDLEARRTRNPDLLDLLLDASVAREDDWLDVNATPIQDPLDRMQDEAVVRAMHARDVLVVQGPPGTGKTTFISELVLRHLREYPGDTVLVASQTHHATDHLLLRVHAADADVPLVRLAAQWQIDERKVAEKVLPFWLHADAPRETRARSRAERYRRFMRAQVAVGAWEPAAAELLLGIQHEYLGTDGLRTPAERRLDEARVVAGTCHGVSGDPSVRDRTFQLAIVEEAGKASPTEALLAMLRAEKVVLVGDVRQLPPTPDRALDRLLRDADEEPERIAERWLREPAVKLAAKLQQARREIADPADRPERYNAETLFAHLGRQLRAERPRLELTLTRQYRMASGIGDLIRTCFYGGTLENGYDDTRRDPRAVAFGDTRAHVILADVAGVETSPRTTSGRKSKSFQNTKEATRAARMVATLQTRAAAMPETDDGRRLSVAVITGYGAQRKLLEAEIAKLERSHLDVRVGTVDSFQGDEAEVVIVSLVRTERPGFMESPNRVNVALSRARSLVIVLVSLPEARSGKLGRPLREVVEYVQGRRDERDKRYEIRLDTRGRQR
jgi:hypothetical protein